MGAVLSPRRFLYLGGAFFDKGLLERDLFVLSGEGVGNEEIGSKCLRGVSSVLLKRSDKGFWKRVLIEWVLFGEVGLVFSGEGAGDDEGGSTYGVEVSSTLSR